MKQEKILELLKEAARTSCTIKRRNNIQNELREELSIIMNNCDRVDHPDRVDNPGRANCEGGRGAGMMLLLDMLYIDTVHHRPEALPALFPFFAMICGDRTYLMTADVDWSLYPQ